MHVAGVPQQFWMFPLSDTPRFSHGASANDLNQVLNKGDIQSVQRWNASGTGLGITALSYLSKANQD